MHVFLLTWPENMVTNSRGEVSWTRDPATYAVTFLVFNILAWGPLFMYIFGRLPHGHLGYRQQLSLQRHFYHKSEDIAITDINRNHWPVPPLFICNCTQHDVTEAVHYINAPSEPRSFQA